MSMSSQCTTSPPFCQEESTAIINSLKEIRSIPLFRPIKNDFGGRNMGVLLTFLCDIKYDAKEHSAYDIEQPTPFSVCRFKFRVLEAILDNKQSRIDFLKTLQTAITDKTLSLENLKLLQKILMDCYMNSAFVPRYRFDECAQSLSQAINTYPGRDRLDDDGSISSRLTDVFRYREATWANRASAPTLWNLEFTASPAQIAQYIASTQCPQLQRRNILDTMIRAGNDILGQTVEHLKKQGISDNLKAELEKTLNSAANYYSFFAPWTWGYYECSKRAQTLLAKVNEIETVKANTAAVTDVGARSPSNEATGASASPDLAARSQPMLLSRRTASSAQQQPTNVETNSVELASKSPKATRHRPSTG